MELISNSQRENFFNEMKHLYTMIRTDALIMNKYDKRNYFENYKDLCSSCTSLIRNHRLDLLYLWRQDENNEEILYAIPQQQNELNDIKKALLDKSKVESSQIEFGTIYPTIYTFVFIVVRCLIMIKDIERIKAVDYYSQIPKEGVDHALVNIHNGEIIPMFNKVLIEKGEEGISEVVIDEQLNDIINLALLAVANLPDFRWRTTDAAFMKAMLVNEKPLRELIVE